jgi:hypothetical protein
MSNNVVVIYGSGASYASGYKVQIPNNERHEDPFMDRGFFDNISIKQLLEKTKYYPIRKFIEFYLNGRDNIGLEELWTAVDLNYKHITLGTYDWHDETFKNYLYYTDTSSIPYRTMDIAYAPGTGATTYNEYKLLGDCGRNLRELIYESLSKFVLERETSNYCELHNKISQHNNVLGYITFNYDLMLEDSLTISGENPYRYVNVNEDISSFNFLKTEGVIIVKLHGSLNWEFVSKGGPVIYKENAIQPEYIHDKNYKEPAIIPPTLFKQEINDDSRAAHPLTQTILSQWRAAIRLLTEADKLLFVGYSFPPTDFHSRRIFQIAMMHKRSKEQRIKVLYCGGESSHEDTRDNLKEIFVDVGEPVIKNKFDQLCDSEELKEFLGVV